MAAALDNLTNCLLQCGHYDNSVRSAAEVQLSAAGTTSGFGQALVLVSLDKQRPIQARQLAAVYLKQFLKQFWTSGGIDSAQQCRFTDQEKIFIRRQLLTGLQDPSRLMRTAFGLCVAKIAQEDFPEEWPDLFDHLLAGIDSGDPVLVLGVVRCMSLFCDWLDDITIPKLAPRLFPALTRILSDDVHFGPQTRRYAGSVVKTCVVLLSHMRGNPDMPAFQVLAQGAQSWLGPLLSMLTPAAWQRQQAWHQNCVQSNIVMAEDPQLCRGYGVQIESLQTMAVLVGELHQLLGSETTRRVFLSIWQFTEQLMPAYLQQVVNRPEREEVGGGDAGGVTGGCEENDVVGIYDAEGNGVGMDVLMVQIFEFLNAAAVVPHSSVRALLSQGMAQIFKACVVVVQMTQEQMEQWCSGKSVGDSQGENDDVMGSLDLGDLNARNVAAVLVYELMESFPSGEALAAASSAFAYGSQMANSARERKENTWWKALESALLVVGIVSHNVEESSSHGASASTLFNTGQVVQTALDLLRAPQHVPPVLWSRSVWALGRYSWALTTEQGIEVYQIAASTLNNNTNNSATTMTQHHHSLPVRMASCRALIELLPHLSDRQDRSSLLLSAVQGTCTLLSQVSAESSVEALPVVVTALAQFIDHAGTEIAAHVEPHLTPVLVAVWSQHASNPYLCATIVDVFQAIASNQSALPGLQSRLLPTLVSLIQCHTQHLPGVVEYALDLLAVISRTASTTASTTATTATTALLSPAYLTAALPVVLQFMQVSEDNAGLASGTACLSVLVYASRTTLLSVSVPSSVPSTTATSSAMAVNTVNAVESILSVVSRLLSPSLPEQSAVRVGSLVTQLMTCVGGNGTQDNQNGNNNGNNSSGIGCPLSLSVQTQLCNAMLIRLIHGKTGDLTESIVVFFARMLHRNVEHMVGMLTSMQVQLVQGGPIVSGFVALMQRWVVEQASFAGTFQVKVTLLGLALLFTRYGSHISQITVQGDLVVNVNEGRRTRSSGKRQPVYEQVPLPLRIMQLLLRVVDEPEDDDEEEEFGSGMGSSGMGSSGMGSSGIGSSGIFAPADDFEEFMLSDMGGPGFWDDEEMDEGVETRDVVEDPLYCVDLQEQLVLFFKQRTTEEMNAFGMACGHHDQQRLSNLGKVQ